MRLFFMTFQYAFSCLVSFFSLLISCFFLKPITVIEERRTTLEVLKTPFVNCFKYLKESLVNKAKDSLMVFLLNLYKAYVYFLMACLFFIMYFTAYTYLGLSIYRILPILLICVTSALQTALRESTEGALTDFVYKAVIVLRYLLIIFSMIPASSFIIFICAKIPFLRSILIDTIGSLSYKIYVGENPGSKAGALWSLVPKILGAAAMSTAFAAAMSTAFAAGIDTAVTYIQFEQLTESCRIDKQPLTTEQKIAFLNNKVHILTTVGKTAATLLYPSK